MKTNQIKLKGDILSFYEYLCNYYEYLDNINPGDLALTVKKIIFNYEEHFGITESDIVEGYPIQDNQ